jgi:hypothetical protein
MPCYLHTSPFTVSYVHHDMALEGEVLKVHWLDAAERVPQPLLWAGPEPPVQPECPVN